jgi:Kef-type K+ transport system membrane component KefB
MSELVILVLGAVLAFGLAQGLRLPVIPLLVGIGFALAQAGVATGDLNDMLELGLAFLLFSAGIELHPNRFVKHRKAVLWTAASQFVLAAACGFGVALALGFSAFPAAYIGAALGTSSTLVVVRQLQRRVGAAGSYGRIVIGVLLVQDLAMITLLVVLSRLGEGPAAMLTAAGGLAVLIAAALAFQRWMSARLARRLQTDEELLLLSVISVLFGFSWLAVQLGLPLAAGSFLAGLALSAFPANGVSRSILRSLTTVFLALFFTALGARLEMPDLAMVGKVLVMCLVVWLVTPLLVTRVVERTGKLTRRSALTCGLLLTQTSEFSLVLAIYGLKLDQMPEEVFALITWVAVLTMTVTPFVATDRVARRFLSWMPRKIPRKTELRDHVLMLGFGSGGIWALKPLTAAGHRVVVVDEDPAVVAQLRAKGVEALTGDASDEHFLLHEVAGRQAKLVLVALPDPRDAARIARMLPGVTVVARVFEHDHVEPVRAAGAIPVMNSLAAADTFMEWFEQTVGKKEDAAPD